MRAVVTRLLEDELAPLRVLCFAHAGGRAAALADALVDTVARHDGTKVEVFAVDFESEDADADGASFTADALASALVSALHGQFFDKRFVLLGHSLGALTALAVTHLLHDRGFALPDHVILSGIAPRSRWQSVGADKTDDALVALLHRWNGTDPALLAHANRQRSALLTRLRIDLVRHNTLMYWLRGRTEVEDLLLTPTTVYGGDRDVDVPADALRQWALERNNPPTLQLFPGDHFFLTSSTAQPPYLASVLATLHRTIDRVVADSRQRHDQWNTATEAYPSDKCLHDLFREAVRRTPDAVAAYYQDQTLTFRQLDHQSEKLADYLFALGVRPGSISGLFMEHCLEFVVAYVAALKAGGAYMPLELVYPPELLARVMEEAQPTVIVTKKAYRHRLPTWQQAFELDGDWLESIKNVPPMPADRQPTTPDDLAYVVMSSGTTGVPKGICCPHRGAVHSYHWRLVHCPFLPHDRVASHVFFVWELLRPLLGNVPLYVIPDDVIYDPPRLVTYVHRHAITRILFTPSLLQLILDSVDAATLLRSLATLRLVWLCGEVVTIELRDRFAALFPHCELQNLYSVSECHDVSTVDLNRLSPFDAVLSGKYASCGHVMANVRAYVLDDALEPLPLGVPGELYVGGPCLALGYLNRPEQTAQRFPTVHGERVYRTGDRARRLPNGHLELIGRCDFMVKLRGYSVVLGAVEAAIAKHPLVSTAVVLVEGAEGEDKQLVAYVVPETWGALPSVATLRSFLKNLLPHYAIPSVFVQLDALPINSASGKLDRKRMPRSDQAPRLRLASVDLSSEQLHRQQMELSPTEQRLVAIWRHLLKLDEHTQVGDESFFDVGGHSLLATRLISAVRDEWDVHLTLADVLAAPTLRGMAQRINQTTDTNASSPTPVESVAFALEAAALDPAIYPAATRKAGYSRYRVEMASRPPRTVLLTGATGFLGVHILHQLLTDTDVVVYCLVRGADADNRVRRQLDDFKLLASALAHSYEDRVVMMQGDLSKPLLGLGDATFKSLATEIDAIIHNGAEVNLVKPYASLKPANVLGTQEVLRLAVTNGLHKTRVKPVHYVSTNGVFPATFPSTDLLETADLSDISHQLDNGYAQSKWVAEQMCQLAAQRGLPVAVLRPGNMAPSTQTGVWNPSDFMYLLLQGCSTVGAVPKADHWRFDFTPVDFAAKAIVHFAVRRPAQALGQTLHIQNPQRPLPGDEFFKLWAQAIGLEAQELSSDEFRTRVHSAASAEGSSATVQRLAAGMDAFEGYMITDKVFDCSLATPLLHAAGIDCPPVTQELLKRMQL